MTRPPLELTELAFRWPGATDPLFSDISINFAPGTISAVMGANGTGKTSLLEAIAGRLSVENGIVRLGQRAACSDDFNYLPQDSARLLFSHLTLAENISLRRNEGDDSAVSLMDMLLGSDGVLQRYPGQCSGGQRQRAVVCRAIMDMSHFPVTLFDESFSQLSRDAKISLGPVMRKMAKESGAIVLFVTHDLIDAMRFGERVLALSGGRLAIFDTSDIIDEDECWRQTARREEILRSLHFSERQLA